MPLDVASSDPTCSGPGPAHLLSIRLEFLPSRGVSTMKLRFLPIATIAALGLTTAGCGKEVVRGANDPSIDAKALSTGLDKDDIQRALHETLNNLRAAPVMNEWRSTNPPPN